MFLNHVETVSEASLLARTPLSLLSEALANSLFLVASVIFTDPAVNSCLSEDIVVNIAWILLSLIKNWFKRK